jgi:hypothetical protein
MASTAEVAAEITTSLPCFGLWVTRRQAERIAEMYVGQRPTMSANALAEALIELPDLDWDQEDEPATKLLIMRSLLEHLDGMYFVETQEHDG